MSAVVEAEKMLIHIPSSRCCKNNNEKHFTLNTNNLSKQRFELQMHSLLARQAHHPEHQVGTPTAILKSQE